MNVLISTKLQKQLAQAPDAIRQTLPTAVHLLGDVTRSAIGPHAKRLAGTNPELFVLRVGVMRYIFTFQDDAIVLLSMTAHEDPTEDSNLGYVDRFRAMPKKMQESEVDSKIADSNHKIFDEEGAAGAMAETNAFGWDVDEYEIESFDVDEDEIRVELTWHATGDQDDDRAWHGDEMRGSATAVIDQDGKVCFRDVSARVLHPGDDQA